MRKLVTKPNSIGVSEVDVNAICQQDWMPALNKRGTKLCRDACIEERKGKYRLKFVRGHVPCFVERISKEQAESIIKRVGLTPRENGTLTKTYRMDWTAINELADKRR